MSELENVAHEHGCQTNAGTDNGRHDDGADQCSNHTNQEPPPGIKHSIRPGVPAPEAVLVAVMTDGSYLLMAYPQREPAAFVARDDAGLLREALTAAFQSPVDEDSGATGKNGNGMRVVVPGYKAPPSQQTQP